MTSDLGNKKIMAENILRLLESTGKNQKQVCKDLIEKTSGLAMCQPAILSLS